MGIAIALCVGCAGPAWAGGGGADAGTLQSFLDDSLCPFLGIANCPQLFPNVTELVLETAGLENAPPEMVRAANSIPPTAAVTVGNPPAGSPFPSAVPPPNVAPLSFISPVSSRGALTVAQPGDQSANSFFYAATDGVTLTQAPDTLFLTYDYPPLTNPTAANARGKSLAEITLPLTVLQGDGSEVSVPTLLQVTGGAGCRTCVKAVATANFPGKGTQTVKASDLGLEVTLTFVPSPNSADAHAIFQVQVPLLVTVNDPAYFNNPISLALPALFVNPELGFTPGFLGLSIGMAPVAAEFTAKIADNSGNGIAAVDAFLAIATDGETLVSAPLP
ncbi:MAG TPA: hypothetical protein VGS13_03090 [Stellaceae bacterium]|nr:hypothetical protein [Stellaceae bacterium]